MKLIWFVHTFIANRILMNVSSNPQSIVLTGETGAGKTESAMHLLFFMSSRLTDLVTDDNEFALSIARPNVTQLFEARNIIFETFGNAKTRHNSNSSRYCKLTEVHKFFITMIKI